MALIRRMDYCLPDYLSTEKAANIALEPKCVKEGTLPVFSTDYLTPTYEGIVVKGQNISKAPSVLGNTPLAC